MKTATRNRLIIGAAVLLAGGFVAREMFFSLTPPRHADHDHAMSTLDAGGFLWIKDLEGNRRNLVGRPGHVLVLHWFDPAAGDPTEQLAAVEYAASVGDDPTVEVLLIARADAPGAVAAWASDTGLPRELLHVDEEGRTAELIGVRRYPETLIYTPDGTLAHQARGPADWASQRFAATVARAREGIGAGH